MAITSVTTKTDFGKTVAYYNNNVIFQLAKYDVTNKIFETSIYNTKGVLTEIDTILYNSTGRLTTLVRYDVSHKVIDTSNYNYNSKNQVDTIFHYNANGIKVSTDYYVNNLWDHTTKEQLPAPITNGWSSIAGNSSIDVSKALSEIVSVQDVIPIDSFAFHLKTAHFEDAWGAGYTGKGIVIADLDSGIDLNNADLSSSVSSLSYNFVDSNTNVQDNNGHGTFTASEMIASNNGDSVIGGSYDAQLLVLKVANQYGCASSSNVMKAIYYAVDNGADIINLSMGSSLEQPMVKSAMDYARQHNVLISVSSGNTLSDKPQYPAIYATSNGNICAVGATFNLNGNEAFNAVSSKAGSNTAYNYVTATGTNVVGYDQLGAVTVMGGTSMAAPLVASEMAILKQALKSTSLYTTDTIDDAVMKLVTHDTHSIQLVGITPIAGCDNLIV